MDDTTLKIAIAAFIHDIGKFADKEALGVTEQYINDNSNYFPYHAVYTAAFIEYLKKDLPYEFNSGGWGEGDKFIKLAAGHHNPETPMQQIIAVADWLTSGMDSDEFDKSEKISIQIYKKTRLLPLFEQLQKPRMDDPELFSYVYSLKPLSPVSIFPEKRSKIQTDDDAIKEYRKLFDGFTHDLKMLRHKDKNLALWFDHFESLTMVYTSAIPAAGSGSVMPDVSLYDHCRLTSAFATAIYLYHKETESLDAVSIKNGENQKFLMISGNFYGIQDFIFADYGDTRKYRSKLLRGRSFYLSLLSELAADLLCKRIGLPPVSVILNAAGKFTILAQNTDKALSAIKKTKQDINKWLMDISFGEISIGFSHVAAGYKDFSTEKFMDLWEKMGSRMEENKFSKIDLNRHGGVIAGYLDQFDNQLDHPMCPLCGKRPAEPETNYTLSTDQIGSICQLCRDHVFIGTQLVKNDRIIITSKDAKISGNKNQLMEPVFGQYQLLFSSYDAKDPLDSKQIFKYWDISLYQDGAPPQDVSKKIINSYVPIFDKEDKENYQSLLAAKSKAKQDEMIEEIHSGDPKTFNHIAVNALDNNEAGKISGVEALGALKADVDYLGMLMGCGLERQKYTISRLAALSRQLNYYFALYLPHLFMTDKRFKNIYTVFAGGDDLFLIGPWNRIYELSLILNKTFSDYVCKNPNIHFSAGISLYKAHTPLNNIANSAEAALEKSKSKGRDQLTMFFQTATWDEVKQLENIWEKFETWLQNEWLTKSMLHRLNEFISMAAMDKQARKRRPISIDDMNCFKWRALFYYFAERNIGKKIETKEKRREIVDELTACMVKWLKQHEGRLRIPLWNVVYNHR
ncbi:MAG: type III-A CRISPR-associated protein Cas10/Csm1 [Desulfobacterales bacterium]|nr:type III-A CRISPR-associated protein Cas10/Csm1 [Desulfobacterales bacterium]